MHPFKGCETAKNTQILPQARDRYRNVFTNMILYQNEREHFSGSVDGVWVFGRTAASPAHTLEAMVRTSVAALAIVACAASADAFSLGGARMPLATQAASRATCTASRVGVSNFFSQRKVAPLRSVAAPGLRMQATIEQTNVAMPALSSTMTEGKIVQWTKSVGDKVSAGDILMVVESDKADMDVESFEDGYLAAILVEDGETAAVGSTVAILVPTELVLLASEPFTL
jgi:biotin carboxyl carrier protein